jgi:hypothetical protein
VMFPWPLNVRHPQDGAGTVKTISNPSREIHFKDGLHHIAPEASDPGRQTP